MPSRPPRLCACGHRVAAGLRCPCERTRDAERKARFDKGRPSAAARGLDADWRRLRAEHLKAHPFCIRCGAPAREVDHIIPRAVAPERRLDPTNLASMCRSCHSGAKQREERRQRMR
jgi:5-methylcytosine-specific restriction endonuclease McrA